jgi:hypothetical protein
MQSFRKEPVIQQTAGESPVSPEYHLDNFDVVPARKRRLAHCQCLPRNGTKFSTVPSSAHWPCYLPGGTDTTRTFTPWCIKAGEYSRNVGTVSAPRPGCYSHGACNWKETWRQITILLVPHHSYLGCYPFDSYDLQRLPIFLQKTLI